MLYIGVVGQIAAGKGILVRFLTEKLGFVSFSLSSIVHDELRKKGEEPTRQTLQDMGDELRRGFGDDVLARRLNEVIKGQKRDIVVIEGIRNPAEIEFFKKNQNFILIGVKTGRELRFKRLLSRGKTWDPKNWNDFLKADRRDLGIGQDRSGQQVGKCFAYCDYVLTNNKDLKDFQRKMEELFIHKLFPSRLVGK
jgi:dephospho-CoA kinase